MQLTIEKYDARIHSTRAATASVLVGGVAGSGHFVKPGDVEGFVIVPDRTEGVDHDDDADVAALAKVIAERDAEIARLKWQLRAASASKSKFSGELTAAQGHIDTLNAQIEAGQRQLKDRDQRYAEVWEALKNIHRLAEETL